jgi:Domain of unknown function (DUF4333)
MCTGDAAPIKRNQRTLMINLKNVRFATFGATVVALAIGVAGCGEATLNVAKLETNIKSAVADAYKGRTIGAVKCPLAKDIKVVTGGTFECQVTVDDATGAFLVTQDDDKGNVHYKQATAFLDRELLETKIGADISTQADAEVTVSCGNAKVMAYKLDDTFICKATDGETTNNVKMTVADIAGNVKWEIV